jgi:RNA polymerase sigma-70 factor, ECF subfamily
MSNLDQSSVTQGTTQEVAQLAEKARYGDRTAFERLVDMFQSEIFRMIYFRIRSQMDAEDLTQDVFLQVYKSLSSLKDFDRFRPWLYSIAVNRVRDFYRKKRLLTFFGLMGEEGDAETEGRPDDRPGALDQLIKKEFWKRVRKMSETFSTAEREVFFLRFLDNLSIKEIAHALHKSESAVKTHLYRSLKKFRDRSDDMDLSELLQGEKKCQ